MTSWLRFPTRCLIFSLKLNASSIKCSQCALLYTRTVTLHRAISLAHNQRYVYKSVYRLYMCAPVCICARSAIVDETTKADFEPNIWERAPMYTCRMYGRTNVNFGRAQSSREFHARCVSRRTTFSNSRNLAAGRSEVKCARKIGRNDAHIYYTYTTSTWAACAVSANV